MAMIAITTSSSTRVNPGGGVRELAVTGIASSQPGWCGHFTSGSYRRRAPTAR